MIYIYLNFICEKEQWILCSDCNEETLVVLIFFADIGCFDIFLSW